MKTKKSMWKIKQISNNIIVMITLIFYRPCIIWCHLLSWCWLSWTSARWCHPQLFLQFPSPPPEHRASWRHQPLAASTVGTSVGKQTDKGPDHIYLVKIFNWRPLNINPSLMCHGEWELIQLVPFTICSNRLCGIKSKHTMVLTGFSVYLLFDLNSGLTQGDDMASVGDKLLSSDWLMFELGIYPAAE